mmetsp:Transcript_37673/g.105828  ORF Transcript_37673/g.105828 Transcript_37673/m.105828 type:complete len:312 (-) Transcript_37673:194-1129(-)
MCFVESILDGPRPSNSKYHRPRRVARIRLQGSLEMALKILHEGRRVVLPEDLVDLEDLVPFQNQLVRVLLVPLGQGAMALNLADRCWLPVAVPLEAQRPTHQAVDGRESGVSDNLGRVFHVVHDVAHRDLSNEIRCVFLVVRVLALQREALVLPNPWPLDVELQYFTRTGHSLTTSNELAFDAIHEGLRVRVPLDVVDLDQLVANMDVLPGVGPVPLLNKANFLNFVYRCRLEVGVPVNDDPHLGTSLVRSGHVQLHDELRLVLQFVLLFALLGRQGDRRLAFCLQASLLLKSLNMVEVQEHAAAKEHVVR